MRTKLSGRFVAAALVAGLGLPTPAAAVQDQGGARPELDVRLSDRAKVPAETDRARDRMDARLGIQGTVATDPVNGGVRAVGRTDGFLTERSSRDPAAIALAYVREREPVFGLDAADLDALRLAARYTDIYGVTHLTWRQTSRGLPSYDGTLNVNVARDGRILNVTGSPVHDLEVGDPEPVVSAIEAIGIARQDVGGSMTRPADSAARLVVLADPDGDRLAWRVTVSGREPYVYRVVVDARSGELLLRHSLTDFASDASIFDYRPGAGAGQVARTVDLAADPAWLDQSAGNTRLFGRNTHTYADVGGSNGFDPGEDIAPSAGANWVYPQVPVTCGPNRAASVFSGICTWDGVDRPLTEPTNRAQTTTQLFYLVNRFHDWLEAPPFGFNDASHNFELGGAGGDDQVNAEADDSGGMNNASMSTPGDGAPPRMQMYLFGSATLPAVSSADDASIVFHEYTHGLSNRLVGNGLGDSLASKQGQAMGEGWSDWYAMDYLVQAGYVSDTAADGEVREGEYATNKQTTGIRRNSIDCSVGAQDASHCPGTPSAGPGGFTFDDMGRIGSYGTVGGEVFTRFQVHDDGEIWSETLWDLRRAIGAPAARALVTQAMRLAPPHPGFLDMRDAILLADAAVGGANRDDIWAVFAARGMGAGASTRSANATSGTPSRVVPSAVATPGKPVVSDPAPLGDGDNVAEPGETVKLRIPLRNLTPGQLSGVTATLSSSIPGVLVGQPVVSYPSIPALATSTPTATFAATLPAASVGCGGNAGLSLAIGSGPPTPIDLRIGTRAGTSYALGGLPEPIPDGGSGTPTAGLLLSLVVPDSRRIDTLRVKLKLAHSFIGNLTARLTSPSGTRIDLFERPGRGALGSNSNDLDVTLEDAAPSNIQDRPNGGVATVGAFQPDEPLEGFRGEEMQGTWLLRLLDSAVSDVGTLQEFAIEAAVPACSTTAPALPAASTSGADSVTQTAATLNGAVNPRGAATELAFQHGRTKAYGAQVAAGSGTGSSAIPARASLSGLAGGTTYHFRTVALRAGTVIAAGADRAFTTPTRGSGSGRRAIQPSVAGLPRALRLSRAGGATFRFLAKPARARGTIAFRTIRSKRNRRAVAFGKARFTVSAGGKVAVRVRASKRTHGKLRKLRKPRAVATIVLGGKRFLARFSLRVPGRNR